MARLRAARGRRAASGDSFLLAPGAVPLTAYLAGVLLAWVMVVGLYSFWTPEFYAVSHALTTQNYAAAFTQHLYVVLLVKSLAIGVACAVLITLIGFVVAYSISFRIRRGGALLRAIIMSPLHCTYGGLAHAGPGRRAPGRDDRQHHGRPVPQHRDLRSRRSAVVRADHRHRGGHPPRPFRRPPCGRGDPPRRGGAPRTPRRPGQRRGPRPAAAQRADARSLRRDPHLPGGGLPGRTADRGGRPLRPQQHQPPPPLGPGGAAGVP